MKQKGFLKFAAVFELIFWASNSFAGADANAPNPYIPAGGLNTEITPWLDKDGNTAKGYQECGQNCMYHKANENLSLESRYIKNLVIEKASGSSSSMSAEESLVVVKQLRSIRNSVGSNEKNIQNLQGDPDDVKATFLEKKDENLKPADVPYVETSDALARDMARRARTDKNFKATVKNLETNSSKEIDDRVQATAPKLEDFPLFEQVPRDKSNPGGEKIWVKKFKDGVAQYDKAAFQEAKTQYDEKYGAKGTDLEKLKTEISKGKDDYLQSLKNLSTKQIGPKGEAPDLLKELAPTHTGDEATSPAKAKKVAFKKARTEVVDAANRGIQKESGKGLVIKNSSGGGGVKPVNEDVGTLKEVGGTTPGYNASVSVIDSDLLDSDKASGKAVDKEFKNYLSATPKTTGGVVADVTGESGDRKVAGQNDQIEIKNDDKKDPSTDTKTSPTKVTAPPAH